MTRKVDIVIQGGLWPSTIDSAHSYLSNKNVNKVYVSTWKGENYKKEITDDRVILIENDKPSYIGPGNLHLHLLSTRVGLENCEKDIVLKVRSDEKISDSGLTTWIDFFFNHEGEETLSYLDGTKQKSKICAVGVNTLHPYHPQDHVFIGYKSDLLKFFNMPFSEAPPQGPEPVEFSTMTMHLRNPIYIGSNYYAMFFDEAKHHLNNYKDYLLDDSPKRSQAMSFYLKHIDSIFRPMPIIDLWWEKFNQQYPWSWYGGMGDMYGEMDV